MPYPRVLPKYISLNDRHVVFIHVHKYYRRRASKNVSFHMFVSCNVMTDGEVYWIGLTRRLPGSDRAAFGWMSGEPLVYSNFGDLNYGTGCLQIQERDGYTKWNAEGCHKHRGYICERRGKRLSVTHNKLIKIIT